MALLGISAFLYGARFVVAARIAGELNFENNKVIFNQYLEEVGGALLAWSIVALCAGIAYIVLSEIEGIRAKSMAKQ